MTASRNLSEAERLCEDGYALLEAGRLEEAANFLRRAAALAPDYPLAHYRLAMLFSDTGRPADAVSSLDRVLVYQPENARAHNNRGAALELLRRLDEAEASFRRALALAPELELPYVNLGKLLERRGKPDQAADVYRRALAAGLDASLFGHYLAAASGQITARAPDSWVRNTFDNFAPLFDQRLRELHYEVPKRLAELIRPRVSAPIDILDLGCGTGQCGVALASLKARLVGVDLSEKMLTRARIHGVYDDLHVAEMQGWLARAPAASIDLVVAADVFIYVGALEAAFREVARILRPSGLMAFSTEECSDTDFTLLPTGRYAQSETYIRRLAEPAFAVVEACSTVVRLESGNPIGGRLFLLQRR